MKHVHLLPNVITAFGLSCGLFVIFKMNMIETGGVSYQSLLAVAGILLLACLADLLDGAVARAMKAESDFGGLFDCLADAITFGVGPSIIVLKSLSITPKTELSFFITTAAMVYSLCGVLRLVRFSLLAKKAKADQTLLDTHNKFFTGLPIPGAAAAVVSGNLLFYSDEFRSLFALTENEHAWSMILMLIVIGYLMVSRWKFPSAKSLHIRVSSFQVVVITVISAALIFYGLISHFAMVFFAAAWGYIVVAIVLSLIRLISGRKLKTLEDFDPAPDEMEDGE